MAENREKELFAELEKVLTTTVGYRFHWTVANRIPTSYGQIPFIANIGISWLDHKQEIKTGPSLYNDREPSTWSGVSDREECAQAVACQVIFDANNSLTDVLKADEGECLVNASWTIAPKSGVRKKLPKSGPIAFADFFELRRN